MALFGCFSLRAQLSKDLFYPLLLQNFRKILLNLHEHLFSL